MEGISEDCCMQCFTDNNGLNSDFFTVDMFGKSIVQKVAKDIEEKQIAELLNIGNFKPDFESTDIKVKQLQQKP